MIERCRGDVLNADVEALVNTVNCVGIMGRGVALQFRKAFPGNYKVYRAACDKKQLRPGKMLVFELSRTENPRFIINFPTKRHWRADSRIGDIESGLGALVSEVKNRGIRSIAIPPLGCGLGGLDWEEVRPRIEKVFEELSDVRTMLYEPTGAPAPQTRQVP
jgi:O-acetyl-ADP-ribose deacetylase (regulator of RNase III)